MQSFLNRVAFLLPRNGTNSHTVRPNNLFNVVSGSSFTPTVGRLLVVAISCPDGNTVGAADSWTEIISSTGTSEDTRLLSKTASGVDSLTSTHVTAAGNYPMVVEFFEYPVGSTVAAFDGKISYNQNDSFPGLGNQAAFSSFGALITNDYPAGFAYSGTTFSTGSGTVAPFESTDVFTNNDNNVNGTTGLWYASAYGDAAPVGTTWSLNNINDSSRDSRVMIVWSVTVPAYLRNDFEGQPGTDFTTSNSGLNGNSPITNSAGSSQRRYAVPGHNSGSALSIDIPSAGGSYVEFPVSGASASNRYVVRGWFRLAGISLGQSYDIIAPRSSGGRIIQVTISATNKLVFFDQAGVNISTGTVTIPSDTWVFIEVGFTVTGGLVDWAWFLDGSSVPQETGNLTGKTLSTNPIIALRLGQAGTNTTAFANFLVDDFMAGELATGYFPIPILLQRGGYPIEYVDSSGAIQWGYLVGAADALGNEQYIGSYDLST